MNNNIIPPIPIKFTPTIIKAPIYRINQYDQEQCLTAALQSLIDYDIATQQYDPDYFDHAEIVSFINPKTYNIAILLAELFFDDYHCLFTFIFQDLVLQTALNHAEGGSHQYYQSQFKFGRIDNRDPSNINEWYEGSFHYIKEEEIK